MKLVKPNSTETYNHTEDTLSVFLAGTIDNGTSEDWQVKVTDAFKDTDGIVFYNPRRNDWDSGPDKKVLHAQIKWEQEHLDSADLIVMCLLDNSKSPITLLELGLYAQSGKLVVFCTDKFYRYDNVKLTCEKYLIDLEENTDSQYVIDFIKNAIDELKK